MEVDFYPAGSFLDRFTIVVRPPALHERQPEYTEPPEIIHPYTSSCTEAHGWSYASHSSLSPWQPASGYSGRLSSCGCLSCGSLLLHLSVTLSQVKYLGMSQWIDLMDCIPWSSSRLPVQVIRLNEDGVVAPTPDPNIALSHQIQLNSLPYVQPCLFTCLRPVYVAQRSQTEPIATAGVHIPIHYRVVPGARDLENLPHLRVQLKVANTAPKLRHK